jgi:hypothetical protein
MTIENLGALRAEVNSISAYAQVGATYIERGWCAIPTVPGEKRPGEYRRGQWSGMGDWRDRYSHRLPGRFEIEAWTGAPGAGGVGLVCGRQDHVVVIDVDTDDPNIKRAIEAVLPPTTFRKRAAKGESLIFRGAGIETKAYNGPEGRILDVLSDGRFCVLPPSLHPSGCLYVWTGPDTFEDFGPADLPEISPAHIEAIGEALKAHGVQPEPDPKNMKAARGAPKSGTDMGRWRDELNNKALDNLDAWVPQLGLCRCQHQRDGSYKAVATWRRSNTGQPDDKRKLNLSISYRGVSDWGDGPRGYSSFDLVMAARRCSYDEAYDWLENLVDPPTVVIALPKKMGRNAKTEGATVLPFPGAPAEPTGATDHDPVTGEVIEPEAAPAEPAGAAEPEFSWDNPDLHYLSDGRTAPPIFPLDLLPKFWADWCAAHSKARYTPLDYTACTLLAATAGLVLNRRSAQPGPEWTEPTILWLATVGESADGKTPGMQPVIKLMNEIEKAVKESVREPMKEYLEKLEIYKLERKQWEDNAKLMRQGGDTPPPPPEPPDEVIEPRVMVTEATTEALVRLLSMHGNGLLQYRDELKGWLGNMNRYAGGGGSDRQFWLEAYQGGVYNVDRVKYQVPLTIPYLSVGVIGGIQPDVLADLLKGANDGFMGRFLWTWPNPVPGFSIVRDAVANGRQRTALQRIFDLDMSGLPWERYPIQIRYSVEAQKTFETFVIQNKARKTFGLMKGSIGKGPAHVVRLSMVLSLLDWAHQDQMPEPKQIEAKYVAAAINLVEKYFYPMAQRAFHEAAMPDIDVKARKLIQWLRNEGLQTFNAKVVRQAIGGDIKDSKAMDAACGCLAAAHLIRSKPSRQGGTAGRMAKDFEANPRIWESAA